jgi:outer membrane biosynthesis protein TonB
VPSGLGLRVALLAAALVVVAVVAVVASWSAWTIIAVMGVAFLVVSAIEVVASKREAARTGDAPSDETLEHAEEEPPPDVGVLAEEPTRESEPEPEPPPPEPERPPLVVAPPPPARKPARSAPSEPEPAPSAMPVAVRAAPPREWNLWELEQASRKASGEDPMRDEERNYLLVYLREFANAEGTLPADFDALVRDSFADVIPTG